MEEFYSKNRMNVMSGSSENGNQVENDPRITGTTSHTGGGSGGSGFHGGPIVLNDANINILQFETDQGMAELLKTQIANHPHYPDLVAAYIGCQKVGAPPEMKNLLDEIARLSLPANPCRSEIGADPQLDQFMDAYCEVLHIFKEELSKVVEEATTFLSNIETKLSNLCRDTFQKTNWDYNSAEEAIGSSEEDFSYGEVEVAESQETSGFFRGSDKELKDMLLHKYSGYLGKLKKDFLKTRKKGKLPKDARSALLDWWNTHFRWPYPTEEEKLQLSVVTGLDQRQINNWFINQRKRHWKPSEDMQFSLMENVRGSSNGGEASGLPFDTGFGNEDFM